MGKSILYVLYKISVTQAKIVCLWVLCAADVPGVDKVRGYGAASGERSQDGEPRTPETLCLCHLQGVSLPLPLLSLTVSQSHFPSLPLSLSSIS